MSTCVYILSSVDVFFFFLGGIMLNLLESSGSRILSRHNGNIEISRDLKTAVFVTW